MADESNLPGCRALAAFVVGAAFRDLTSKDPTERAEAKLFLLRGLWGEELPWATLLDLDRDVVADRVRTWTGKRLKTNVVDGYRTAQRRAQTLAGREEAA